jgi:hypothetical protein
MGRRASGGSRKAEPGDDQATDHGPLMTASNDETN